MTNKIFSLQGLSFEVWQVYQYPSVQLVLPQLDPLVDQSVVAFRLHPLGTRVEHFEPVRVQVFVFRVGQHLVPI